MAWLARVFPMPLKCIALEAWDVFLSIFCSPNYTVFVLKCFITYLYSFFLHNSSTLCEMCPACIMPMVMWFEQCCNMKSHWYVLPTVMCFKANNWILKYQSKHFKIHKQGSLYIVSLFFVLKLLKGKKGSLVLSVLLSVLHIKYIYLPKQAWKSLRKGKGSWKASMHERHHQGMKLASGRIPNCSYMFIFSVLTPCD